MIKKFRYEREQFELGGRWFDLPRFVRADGINEGIPTVFFGLCFKDGPQDDYQIATCHCHGEEQFAPISEGELANPDANKFCQVCCGYLTTRDDDD